MLRNFKTSKKNRTNYIYYPSEGQPVIITPNDTSYVKLSNFIKNKFPNEPLPNNGKILDYTIQEGRITDIQGLRRMDFVINKDGNLVIGRKHQMLGNADDVFAAGQLKVDGYGMIRRIDNNSGHYRPTVEESIRYPQLLKNAGFNLDKAWLEINDFKPDFHGNIIDSKNVVHKKLSVRKKLKANLIIANTI